MYGESLLDTLLRIIEGFRTRYPARELTGLSIRIECGLSAHPIGFGGGGGGRGGRRGAYHSCKLGMERESGREREREREKERGDMTIIYSDWVKVRKRMKCDRWGEKIERKRERIDI